MGARDCLVDPTSYLLNYRHDEGAAGVYYFFFKDGLEILERAGYFLYEERLPMEVSGAYLLYVGKSVDDLYGRVKAHLKGDARQSTMRVSLGCILADELGLHPVRVGRSRRCHFGTGEASLSAWLEKNAFVATNFSSHPVRLERETIQSLAPPLNIVHRRNNSFARHLIALRERYGYFANIAHSGPHSNSQIIKKRARMNFKGLRDAEKNEKGRIGPPALKRTQVAEVDLARDREVGARQGPRSPTSANVGSNKVLPSC